MENQTNQIVDTRLPAIGTVLRREYQGKTYHVRVDGPSAFYLEEHGTSFPSLTAVAKAILPSMSSTGKPISVNGWDWFGLGSGTPGAPRAVRKGQPVAMTPEMKELQAQMDELKRRQAELAVQAKREQALNAARARVEAAQKADNVAAQRAADAETQLGDATRALDALIAGQSLNA